MKRYLFFGFLVFFVAAGAFAQVIGRVAQSGSTFVVFTPAGSRISSTRIGRNESHTLVGWGSDFFIVQNLNTISSHDPRGRRIGEWSIGGPNTRESIISRVIVTEDAVTIFIIGRGVVPVILDRTLRER